MPLQIALTGRADSIPTCVENIIAPRHLPRITCIMVIFWDKLAVCSRCLVQNLKGASRYDVPIREGEGGHGKADVVKEIA